MGNPRGPGRFAGIGVVAVLFAALLSACSSGPAPQTTATAYLAAWSKQDWTAMRQLVAAPPADFTSVNTAAFTDLHVSQATFTAGTLKTSGSTATEPVTEHLNLAGLGSITIRPTLHLVQSSGHWLVKWSPATIAPPMRAGDKLTVTTTWLARAAIEGAGGVPLTGQSQLVTIGVEGSLVKNATSLTSALVAAGATAEQASTAITAAKAHPTFFEPVFTVPQARYEQLKPTLYPLPGTVFQSSTSPQAVTPGLTAGVVGTVGPVTAQELQALGAAYSAQSIVGQSGLEAANEHQLAGTPDATIAVVSAKGTHVATLATMPGHAGTPVQTTIDPTVQRAAEAALSGEKKSAAIVAVNAQTGALLAAANANSGQFDQALDGAYPPGSTFKVLTSTALINHGLSPSSAASCPTTATAGGEVFHNADGEGQVSDLLHAFVESCNTAFIGLATKNLSPSDFTTTATLFGLGKAPQMGLPAYAGSVPTPADQADLGATSIGQGRVLASPLNMAMVAAAADTGTVHTPRLVVGAPDDTAATQPLPATVVADLHQMMGQVVTSGTAAGQGLPAGTFGKTGTAEYGTTKPLKTDAWLIGFKGNIAFAVLVVDSKGNGGPTCGPIAAKFLSAAGA
jgi:Penicillin binding protein transpeptidase domain/Penicillin-binding Protein dimerisation domain/NTF2-like N-terminal transpeptidase domain